MMKIYLLKKKLEVFLEFKKLAIKLKVQGNPMQRFRNDE